LIWIERGSLGRRTIIVCVFILEEIVKSMGLFADKEDKERKIVILIK
jgi:hypothetical protein